MTYQQAIQQYLQREQDTPCSIESCYGMRFPFGIHKGEPLTAVLKSDPEWFRQFTWCMLTKEVKHDQFFDDNLAFVYGLRYLLNEYEATQIGEKEYKHHGRIQMACNASV